MADQPGPQLQLRTARAALATVLRATSNAVEDPNATPAMIGAAMQGLLQAQTAYNQAVPRIPLLLMTDGALLSDDAAQPAEQAARDRTISDHPAAKIVSDNPRVWADRFLAENRDNVIDRESLVHWFGHALAAGHVGAHN